MIIHNHHLTSRATLTLFVLLQVILCNTSTAQIISLESSIMMSSSTLLEGSSYWYPNEQIASMPKSPDKRTISFLSDFFLWKEGIEKGTSNSDKNSNAYLSGGDQYQRHYFNASDDTAWLENEKILQAENNPVPIRGSRLKVSSLQGGWISADLNWEVSAVLTDPGDERNFKNLSDLSVIESTADTDMLRLAPTRHWWLSFKRKF